MRASICRSLTLSILTLSTACASGPEASTATRADSAGIEIVTSTAPSWAVGEGWTVSAEPVVSIGLVSGDDPYLLFQVGDAMRLSDGRIVVANGGTREVRLFAADGSFIETTGGPGQGPREYGYPVGFLSGPGDGFTVIDRLDLIRYDAAGAFIEKQTFDRQKWAEMTSALGPSEGGQPLGDGRMLAPIYGSGFSNSGEPRPGPPFRPEITMVMVDMNTGSIDTLSQIGGIRQQYVNDGTRVAATVGPFSPSGRWMTGRDRSLAIYDGATAEVYYVAPDGARRILRWSDEPAPVEPGQIDQWMETQRNASWAQSRLPQLENAWAQIEMPTEKAMVTDVRPSKDGSIWVRTGASAYEGSAPVSWQIFGPDGSWLGATQLPGTFTPLEIADDYVLGRMIDLDTEVERVLLFQLNKGGGD